MCGIAGWVSYDGDLRAHQDVIRATTETMAAAVRMRVASGSIGTPAWDIAVLRSSTSPAAYWCRSPLVRGEGQVVPYIDPEHRRPAVGTAARR